MAAGDVTVNVIKTSAKLSAQFDGIDDNVDLGSVTALGTSDFTYSCWMRTDKSQTNKDLIGKGNWGGTTGVRACISQTAATTIQFLAGASSATFGSVADGQWHHLVGIRDSNGLRAYLDGVLITTTLISVVDLTYAGNMCIGARHPTAGYWNGSIMGVKVWTKALSDSEIALEYAGGTTLTSLQSYHKLESDYTDEQGNWNGTNTGSIFTNREGLVSNEYKDNRVTANDVYLIAASKLGQVVTTHIEEA
jgi:hypothetical protein